MPNNMLGFDPVIGVWAPVGLRRDGTLVQVDRGGHPTINPFIKPDEAKSEYSLGQPADDVARYLEPWSQILQKTGGYSPVEATAAASTGPPDILPLQPRSAGRVFQRSHPHR
jgi:hypothetical protein